MLTWSGLEAAHTISSAMSSPLTAVSDATSARFCRLTRLEAFVHSVRSGLIASESDERELSLDHTYISSALTKLTWLDLADSDRRIDQLPQQGVVEGRHRVLCRTVDRTTRVRLTSSDRTKVDDHARVALLELSHKDLREVDEPNNIGVHHDVDVLVFNRSDVLPATDHPGVVDENIHGETLELAKDPVEVFAVLHVGFDYHDFALAEGLGFRLDLGELVSPTRSEDEVGAGTSEEFCGGSTDTG